MSIVFNEQNKVFKLDTSNSSYLFKIFSTGHVVSLYYGAKIDDSEIDYMWKREKWMSSFHPIPFGYHEDPSFSPDMSPLEYPTTGVGDYRITALSVKNADGDTNTDLRYKSHKIYAGKNGIKGLPATYVESDDVADTLELHLIDSATDVEVVLFYGVYNNLPVIAQNVKVINNGKDSVYIENIASMCLNLPWSNYDMLHLFGRYYKEHMLTKTKLGHEITTINSTRGSSGHDSNPFAIFAADGYTEETGDVYGVSLLYSGNFNISAFVDSCDYTRVTVGLNPDGFEWELKSGEEFDSPEAVSVFSDSGIGEMSRVYHRLYSKHLIRGYWRDRKRPLLINSWEGTGMNISEEKLLAYAKNASELGFEMLVMDDGWFGKRDNDWTSLGDWYVHSGKFPYGLSHLIDQVNEMGMKFGIWYEPEMISPDSDLGREHPEWFMHTPKRDKSDARHQLIIDMTREDVRDYLFNMMYDVLSNNNIDYVKWDCNRNFSEIYSATLGKKNQGELAHRYILGTYELMERLLTAFPNLLLETCSGGGGRYDAGILYYSPQVWTSDNTDGFDREFQQFATSLCYPASSMGSHVSRNGRCEGLHGMHLKGNVALWGSFGYEMDPSSYTDEERSEVISQVADYHKYYDLIHYGDLYRIEYPYDNICRSTWEFVSEDKSEALLTVVVNLRNPLHTQHVVRLRGLDPNKRYTCEQYVNFATEPYENGVVLTGRTLMNAGVNLALIEQFIEDKTSYKLYFKEVK